MLKILHLNNIISYTSGVTRYIYLVIKNTKNIFEHEIFCLGGDAIERFRNQSIKVNIINGNGLPLIPKIYLTLFSYIKKNNFDIVHNHHRLFDTVISFIPNKKFKTITTVHSKVYGRKMFSYRADKLISYSSAITNHLIQYFDSPQVKIQVMKSIIDESDIKLEIQEEKLKTQLEVKQGNE